MYLYDQTYAEAAAFVLGYDHACEGGVLAGFREWLVVRLDLGENLSWQGLVLHAAFPEAADPQQAACASPLAQRRAIDALFDLLEEFDDIRSGRAGLVGVFTAFDAWSKRRR